jgi:hypothetical protein
MSYALMFLILSLADVLLVALAWVEIVFLKKRVKDLEEKK